MVTTMGYPKSNIETSTLWQQIGRVGVGLNPHEIKKGSTNGNKNPKSGSSAKLLHRLRFLKLHVISFNLSRINVVYLFCQQFTLNISKLKQIFIFT